MSATQDLIAAALTAADELDQLHSPIRSLRADELREACARAMVQPDMAEVERLADEYATAVHDGRDNDCYKTRTALLEAVRAIVEERDALKPLQPATGADLAVYQSIADNYFKDTQPVVQEQEGAPIDWQDAPPSAVGHYPMTKPVGELPMPQPDTHCYDDDVGRDVWSHSPEQMRTYGEQCRAAGYAAGLAACQDALADACCAAEIPDSKYESLMIALRGEVK